MTAAEPKRSIIAGQLYKALELRYLSLIASWSRDAAQHGVAAGIPDSEYETIHVSYVAAVSVVVSEQHS